MRWFKRKEQEKENCKVNKKQDKNKKTIILPNGRQIPIYYPKGTYLTERRLDWLTTIIQSSEELLTSKVYAVYLNQSFTNSKIHNLQIVYDLKEKQGGDR